MSIIHSDRKQLFVKVGHFIVIISSLHDHILLDLAVSLRQKADGGAFLPEVAVGVEAAGDAVAAVAVQITHLDQVLASFLQISGVLKSALVYCGLTIT